MNQKQRQQYMGQATFCNKMLLKNDLINSLQKTWVGRDVLERYIDTRWVAHSKADTFLMNSLSAYLETDLNRTITEQWLGELFHHFSNALIIIYK